MKGKVVSDWNLVDYMSPSSRGQLIGALQHFMDTPRRIRPAQARHFTGAGDLPESNLEALRATQALEGIDTAFENVFDVVDMTSSSRNGFEMVDIEDGLTFDEVVEGDKARIYKFGGSKAVVRFALYGAGLGWHRRLFDDKEYWNIERNAIAFRSKWYSKRAAIAYALIDGIAAGQNLAWQNPSPAALPNTDAGYELSRDINTINKACEQILTDLEPKGYVISAHSRFVILAPMALRPRISRALGSIGVSPAAASGVAYHVDAHYTTGLTASDAYYVALPKHKSIFADRQYLTIYDQFDITTYSDLAVGWGRYGGAIGEVKQFRRCATA